MQAVTEQRRHIGATDICVSPVALGCWPIAGISTLDVNDRDSVDTIRACLDAGVNFLDTAFSYGMAGESERLIARALGPDRDQVVIATKVGIHWNDDGQRVYDARPEQLRRECHESLRRLNTDYVDLLYLHYPDPDMPLAEMAGTMKELLAEGKARCVGVSNFSVAQLEEFHQVCEVSAVQLLFNILQRETALECGPWCEANGVSIVGYWPLMKGLLAGRLDRDHVFQKGDPRAKYPMYQGDEWERNQDFLDELRALSEEIGKSVAQIVVNWTINENGITSAPCGAKRPYQIRETAGAMGWRLSDEHAQRIEDAIAMRGHVCQPW